jgi:hypothetical protein
LRLSAVVPSKNERIRLKRAKPMYGCLWNHRIFFWKLPDSSQFKSTFSVLNISQRKDSQTLSAPLTRQLSENVAHVREVAVPGTNQAISPQKSQNNAGFTKQGIEMPVRRSQKHPGAPAPQGQAARVWLFGTDCSHYDPSGQSKSFE